MPINENGGNVSSMLSEEQMMPAIRWMAEQIPGGFFVYRDDASQELIYVNNVCIRLFGCKDLEEFRAYTGNTFRGLVYPDDYEEVQASIDAQIANPENKNLDYRTVHTETELIYRDSTRA